MRYYALLKQVQYGIFRVAFSSVRVESSDTKPFKRTKYGSISVKLKTEKWYQVVKPHILQIVCLMSHNLFQFCLPFRL